jgi:hypothetical protein
MAKGLCVIVSANDRGPLAAIIDDRDRPLKHIQRAQIMLSRPTVCRCCKWRYAAASAARPCGDALRAENEKLREKVRRLLRSHRRSAR